MVANDHWSVKVPEPPVGLAACIETMPLPVHPLISGLRSRNSTSTHSTTDVTDNTDDLIRQTCRHIHVARFFLERLFGYVSPHPFASYADGAPRPVIRHTASTRPGLGEKPDDWEEKLIDVQSRNLDGARAARQRVLRKPLINNDSVRAEIHAQIHSILDSYHGLVHKNTISEGADYKFMTLDGPNKPTSAVPNADAIAAGYHTPCWVSGPGNNSPDRKQDRSGIPDQLLIRGGGEVRPGDVQAARRLNAAVTEGKAPWNYTPAHFRDLFNGDPDVVGPHGGISFSRGHAMCKLMKQLWVQLFRYCVQIGFVTNMKGVMFIMADLKGNPKTPNHKQHPEANDSTFIVSPMIDWEDPRLLRCALGMSLLAVDILDWVAPVQARNDARRVQEAAAAAALGQVPPAFVPEPLPTVVSILAPPHERYQIRYNHGAAEQPLAPHPGDND